MRDHYDNSISKLKEMGYIIKNNSPHYENMTKTPDDYGEYSKHNINAILSADIILVFMTDKKLHYRGTFTEIGCAIGSNKRIIIICDGDYANSNRQSSSIVLAWDHYCMTNGYFWDSHIEHVSTYDDAIKLLNGEIVISSFKDYYSGELSNELSAAINNNSSTDI